jgi:hypothetical protein
VNTYNTEHLGFIKKSTEHLMQKAERKKAFDCVKLTYIFVQNPELVVSFATFGEEHV